jgi:hypothetical protein
MMLRAGATTESTTRASAGSQDGGGTWPVLPGGGGSDWRGQHDAR